MVTLCNVQVTCKARIRLDSKAQAAQPVDFSFSLVLLAGPPRRLTVVAPKAAVSAAKAGGGGRSGPTAEVEHRPNLIAFSGAMSRRGREMSLF